MNVGLLRSRIVRLGFLFVGFAILLSAYIIRLAYIQVYQHEFWSQKSEQNHVRKQTVDVKRGSICDRNGIELAFSVEVYTVYLYMREIKSLDETITQLATVIPMSRNEIIEKTSSKKGYIQLFKNLERGPATKIIAMNLPGVILEENYRRVYPQNFLASNLLGFCGLDGVGLEGTELEFDRTMRGYQGISFKEEVSYAEDSPTQTRVVKPAAGGSNINLTIDSFIQHILETELVKLVNQYKPIDVTAIAMDPYTGEILGMACLPNYDLNAFSDAAPDSRRNRPVVDVFEPGSCMKIFSAAAALQQKVITDKTTFNCHGYTELYGKRIKCHGSHGAININEAIAESCNSSMIQIAQMLTPTQLYHMYRELGFGSPTGIETPSESQGILSPPSRWSGFSAPSLSIGQEIAVTSIQLVTAYSAIANGGWLMKPRMVKRITSQNNDIKEDFEPERRKQIFSSTLAAKLRSLLLGVVEHGTGDSAKLADYTVGGKTSTAQKANPKGGYYQEKVVASFIGMIPANHPRIVLFVAANEPKGDEKTLYGGKVAAPIFATIADRILKYLKVPPDKCANLENKNNESASATASGASTVFPLMVMDLTHDLSTGTGISGVNANSSKVATLSSHLIPDFTGMTMKEVASLGKSLGLEVSFEGNGVAVNQIPHAGTLKSVKKTVVVKFSPRSDD